MSPDDSLLSAADRESLHSTVLVRHVLEEQYHDLDQQHHAAAFGMWVFLATEVMFFGTLFLGLYVYRYLYPLAFATASRELNWLTGGLNTVVLLVSRLTMVLAVHYAGLGRRKLVVGLLGATALLGVVFLCIKGWEYYSDFEDNLLPGWRFVSQEWIDRGLRPDQVPHVRLFLSFYWVMTSLHALHVTIGILVVLVMLALTWRGYFSADYYTPIDVTGLYWHFVDLVWIFLLPSLYLLGTHTLGE